MAKIWLQATVELEIMQQARITLAKSPPGTTWDLPVPLCPLPDQVSDFPSLSVSEKEKMQGSQVVKCMINIDKPVDFSAISD